MSETWGIIIGVSVFLIAAGIPFTLWWWRIADRWAGDKHRRFARKEDTRERVVVRDPNARP